MNTPGILGQALALGCAVLTLVIGLPAWASGGQRLAYGYHGSRLIVTVPATKKQKAVVTWRAVSESGQPVGGTRTVKGEVGDGAKPIVLNVGGRGGHRVRVRYGQRAVSVWANRGLWYAQPPDLSPNKRVTREAKGLLDSDTLLAGGIRVSFGRPSTEPGAGTPTGPHIPARRGRHGARTSARKGPLGPRTSARKGPLEAPGSKTARLLVGRTLGLEHGFGVRVSARQAIVLRASGTVGAVRLTVTERINQTTVHYYDYPLVLTPKMQRYVIPLRALTPRPKASGKRKFPQTMNTISLTAESVLTRGKLDVDALGLTVKAPRLLSLRHARGGIRVVARAVGRAGMQVGWIGPGGDRNSKPARGSTSIPNSAVRVWVCQPGIGCDPADAPRSGYAAPSPARGAVLIDDFWGRGPVDPQRIPTLYFASNPKLLRSFLAVRNGTSLNMSYSPQGADDYVGYHVRMPRGQSLARMRSVKLTLRGTADPKAVEIGLRDRSGKEPKVCLGDYVAKLGPNYRTVSVPLEAFRARAFSFKDRARPLNQQLVGASIVLGVGTTGTTDPQIELARFELSPQLVPLSLATFDGPAHQTALGGAVMIESRSGGDVRTSLVAGKSGRALQIRAANVGGRAYGLVSLGIQRVNATGYHSLTFWVRGAAGGENPTVVLKDSRKKAVAKVPLSQLVSTTTEWQQASINLSAFKRKINLRDLRLILFIWEERQIDSETIEIDQVELR